MKLRQVFVAISRKFRNSRCFFFQNITFGALFAIFTLLATGLLASSVATMLLSTKLWPTSNREWERINYCQYIDRTENKTSCLALEGGVVTFLQAFLALSIYTPLPIETPLSTATLRLFSPLSLMHPLFRYPYLYLAHFPFTPFFTDTLLSVESIALRHSLSLLSHSLELHHISLLSPSILSSSLY